MSDFMTSIPLIGGMFDDSDDLALRELQGIEQLYSGIKTPDLVWKDYVPELFSNETANYELINEDPALKSQQMDALKRMAGLAETGLSDVDEAGFARARNEGNQMARAGTEAALANAQARGVGGSGLEFAMREIANQGGAQRAQEAGLGQAADSARQRALYAQAHGNALAGVRGQDFQANRANTDVINQFNMANTTRRNQVGDMTTNVKNQAQQMNNQGRMDTQQQRFQNDLNLAGGRAGAKRGVAEGHAAVNAGRTANRNMLTQVGANVGMMAMGMPPVAGAMKTGKPIKAAGQGYGDFGNYV